MASSSDTMLGDILSMVLAKAGNANSLPTEDEFARSLLILADENKFVSFYPQHVTVEKAQCLEDLARETLRKPTQITAALTIPTSAGAAIVSLTSRQTTPTTSKTTCSLSVNEQLIPTLREVAQENAQLPQHLWCVFPKALKTHRRKSHSGTKCVGF